MEYIDNNNNENNEGNKRKRRPYRLKSASEVEKIKLVNYMNIDKFIQDHGIAYKTPKDRSKGLPRGGHTVFCTMTFKQPVYSKKKAESIKSDFLTAFARKYPLKYCCVAEKHESGAYHFHFLMAMYDSNLSIKKMKAHRDNIKFIGFVEFQWTYGSPESVGYYLTQYLTAENINALEGRCISYSKGVARVANIRFAWLKTPWRRDIDLTMKHIERQGKYTHSQLVNYYNTMSRADRWQIYNLWKNKLYNELEAYISYAVGLCNVVYDYKPFSECYDDLRSLNQICADGLEFDNQLAGVPF